MPLVALLLAAAAAVAAAQPSLVLVRVVEAGTGRPVVNADVLERHSGVRRLTDARGEARLPASTGRSLAIRVRQLGFQPAERSLGNWPESGGEIVVVTLSRLVVLSSAKSEASNACRGTADSLPSPLSLLALEQLRFGAEQYDRFWDAYPFRLTFERRTAYFGAEGQPLTVLVRKEETARRNWSDPYRVGSVLHERGATPGAHALSIDALADPVFWEHHCVVARRVVTKDGRRMVPLEFLPALSIRTPDWGGVAWIDSATSELRRVEFQLIGLDRAREVRRMEGFMTFTYPSPYIARPDSIVSVWWLREPAGDRWGAPNYVELLRVVNVRYFGEKPP